MQLIPCILCILSALVVLCLIVHADPWPFILAYWILLVIKNGKEARKG